MTFDHISKLKPVVADVDSMAIGFSCMAAYKLPMAAMFGVNGPPVTVCKNNKMLNGIFGEARKRKLSRLCFIVRLLFIDLSF